MFDRRARQLLAPGLDAAAGVLAAARISPSVVTGVGWLVGVGACVAAGFQLWSLALALWLLNRLLDGLDGPLARRRGATELGGFLDIVADFSVYAGFVLAVAIAVPEARVAALALLTAYYLSGTAFLALSSLIERRGGWSSVGEGTDQRSLRFVGGIAEGTETVVVYVLFCLFPTEAALIAWLFAAAVAITALQRIRVGVRVLRTPLRWAAQAAATPGQPGRQPVETGRHS